MCVPAREGGVIGEYVDFVSSLIFVSFFFNKCVHFVKILYLNWGGLTIKMKSVP